LKEFSLVKDTQLADMTSFKLTIIKESADSLFLHNYKMLLCVPNCIKPFLENTLEILENSKNHPSFNLSELIGPPIRILRKSPGELTLWLETWHAVCRNHR